MIATERLGRAGRSLIVKLSLQRDDGSMTLLTGYRVQDSNALRPAKDGIRYRRGIELDDVTALARLMTRKTALHGLPFERWRTEALAVASGRVTDVMALAGQVTANAHRIVR